MFALILTVFFMQPPSAQALRKCNVADIPPSHGMGRLSPQGTKTGLRPPQAGFGERNRVWNQNPPRFLIIRIDDAIPMKQKYTSLSFNELDMGANHVLGRRTFETAVGRYWMNQPGYYLIRLRLRHSEKALRPLARIP